MHYLIVFALILGAMAAVPLPAEAARLWSSGCELQGDSPATPTNDLEFELDQGGGTMEISTTVKRSGLSACKVSGSGDIYANFGHTFGSAPVTTPVYVRFYLYIDSAPTTNTQVATLFNGGYADMEAGIFITSTRTLRLYDDSDALVGSYDTPLSTGTWYRVEMLYHSASNNIDVRLDGTTVIDASCTACDGSEIFAVGFENFIASPSGTLYYDDIAINDTSGSTQ